LTLDSERPCSISARPSSFKRPPGVASYVRGLCHRSLVQARSATRRRWRAFESNRPPVRGRIVLHQRVQVREVGAGILCTSVVTLAHWSRVPGGWILAKHCFCAEVARNEPTTAQCIDGNVRRDVTISRWPHSRSADVATGTAMDQRWARKVDHPVRSDRGDTDGRRRIESTSR